MFNGKTALVTGSTSGIGLGIARALAARGANVVLNGFGDAAQIAQLRQEIAQAHGVNVMFVGADMSRADAIEAMMARALGEFGAIDLLVNNAGIQHVAPVDAFPIDKWNAILAINLSAAFHTTRLALPAMKRNGFGRIVNVASAHALVASPFKSAYVAAKHGIAGLTKAAALHKNAVNAATCSTVTNCLVGCAASSTSRTTASSLMPRACAVAGICCCTSGVST